jgi:hypothetical protein
LPEWVVETGIGETRAALIEDGRIVEARIELDSTIPAGTIIEARLVDGRIARDGSGTEYLLTSASGQVSQGAALNIVVTRPAIPGPEPWKRPIAKTTEETPAARRPLADRLRSARAEVRMLTLPAARDELAGAGWNDLIEEARSARVEFAGGSLGLFPTPAMTLIDVDGSLPAPELAEAGAAAAAETIRRLDIGGSIGIDLPTVAGKAPRHRVAERVDSILPQPFERTAVNGFGFLQVVRPRTRASLLELAQDRASFEARALLRRIAFGPSGAKRIAGHPALIAILASHADWLDALARQIGGAVTLRSDASLPIHGAHAE